MPVVCNKHCSDCQALCRCDYREAAQVGSHRGLQVSNLRLAPTTLQVTQPAQTLLWCGFGVCCSLQHDLTGQDAVLHKPVCGKRSCCDAALALRKKQAKHTCPGASASLTIIWIANETMHCISARRLQLLIHKAASNPQAGPHLCFMPSTGVTSWKYHTRWYTSVPGLRGCSQRGHRRDSPGARVTPGPQATTVCPPLSCDCVGSSAGRPEVLTSP